MCGLSLLFIRLVYKILGRKAYIKNVIKSLYDVLRHIYWNPWGCLVYFHFIFYELFVHTSFISQWIAPISFSIDQYYSSVIVDMYVFVYSQGKTAIETIEFCCHKRKTNMFNDSIFSKIKKQNKKTPGTFPLMSPKLGFSFVSRNIFEYMYTYFHLISRDLGWGCTAKTCCWFISDIYIYQYCCP